MQTRSQLYMLTLGSCLIMPSAVWADELSAENQADLSGLYFMAGGGKAEFSGNEFPDNDTITVLRYGMGYRFNWVDAEAAYRGYSDGEDLKIRGMDIIAKKSLLEWKSFGLNAGAGAYVYRSKMDNDIFDSETTHSGVAPLLTVGGSYSLNDYVDITLQYDRVFDVEFTSPRYDRRTEKDLDQLMLSLVVRPWAVKDYQPLASAVPEVPEPVTVVETVELFQDSRDSEIYAYDSAQLTDAVKTLLDSVIRRTRTLDHYEIVVTGGADAHPDFLAYNELLAYRRAGSVAQYLKMNGVDKNKVRVNTRVYRLKPGEKDNADARKVTLDIHQLP